MARVRCRAQQDMCALGRRSHIGHGLHPNTPKRRWDRLSADQMAAESSRGVLRLHLDLRTVR